MTRGAQLDALQQRLGYRFSDPGLLSEALVHKSYSNEVTGEPLACNERLEFLGDAVLDLIIGEQAFSGYPDLPEGELTRIRAELVSEKNLAAQARRLDLGTCLQLGRGERRSGGADKPSLLADSFEALIGAVFKDSDYATTSRVVAPLFAAAVGQAARREFDRDCKTRLQELSQKLYRQPPQYTLVKTTGPDHERRYEVEVGIDGRLLARGEGRSKKLAEQQAAQAALDMLEQA